MNDRAYIVLLADIHANELALVEVMRHARERYDRYGPLRIWFLGDLFGRGPAPLGVWRRLMSYRPEMLLAGNHDWGLLDRLTSVRLAAGSHGEFNRDDFDVILRHRQQLVDLGMIELDGDGRPAAGPIYEAVSHWPVVAQPIPGVYLLHGGQVRPLDPADDVRQVLIGMLTDGYVRTQNIAACTIEMVRQIAPRLPALSDLFSGVATTAPRLVLVGHYHRRTLYTNAGDVKHWQYPVTLDHEYPLRVASDGSALISPGSVGFPREDRDRHASYAVLCLEGQQPVSITFHAVPFDRNAVRAAMRQEGYPTRVVNYLSLDGDA